jgi:hypothetical protein
VQVDQNELWPTVRSRFYQQVARVRVRVNDAGVVEAGNELRERAGELTAVIR